MTLDYEADFPLLSNLELALYSTGAAQFPTVVLGRQGFWGTHRRVGVIDIAEEHYDDALDSFAAKVLDRDFVAGLHDTYRDITGRVIALNEAAENNLDGPRARIGEGQVGPLVDAVAELMAFHVLNWALPLDSLSSFLGDILGQADAGRELLMKLLVPIAPAHLSDFAAIVSSAMDEMAAGDWTPQHGEALAREIGYLQAPGMQEREFESGDSITGYLGSLSPRDQAGLVALRPARLSARRDLARSLSRLLLAVDGDETRSSMVEAVIAICRLAAEEEEGRRRLQSRSLRNVRRIAGLLDLDLDQYAPAAYVATAPEGRLSRSSVLTYDTWTWLDAA